MKSYSVLSTVWTGRCENPECRNITEYGGISRNIPEYHGIWWNNTEYHDIFPEYTGTPQYFPMVAMQLNKHGRLTTYFITKVMDLSHFDGKWQTLTLYWKFYMLFISLLRMITKNFEPIWLIPPELIQRLGKQKCWRQHYFRTPSELCFTQNLVKDAVQSDLRMCTKEPSFYFYLGFYFILCSCKAWLLSLLYLLYSRIMKI
jgi:hypothetical protein